MITARTADIHNYNMTVMTIAEQSLKQVSMMLLGTVLVGSLRQNDYKM
jgi:hypothetical protein